MSRRSSLVFLVPCFYYNCYCVVWFIRRQRRGHSFSRARKETPADPASVFVPTGAGGGNVFPRKAVGKAELQGVEKGGVVSESKVVDGNQGVSEKVEVDRRAAEARYGLRPEDWMLRGGMWGNCVAMEGRLGELSCRRLRRGGDVAFTLRMYE